MNELGFDGQLTAGEFIDSEDQNIFTVGEIFPHVAYIKAVICILQKIFKNVLCRVTSHFRFSKTKENFSKRLTALPIGGLFHN